MNRVISLGYYMEDGVWSMESESGDEFKWWNYVVSRDNSSVMNWFDLSENGIRGVVDKWFNECRLNECDKSELFGYEKCREEFVKCLREFGDLECYGVNIVNWGIEYDVNLSFIICEC